MILLLLGLAQAGCPEEVDRGIELFKRERPVDAMVHLQAIDCPEQAARIDYYLGRVYWDLELFVAAEHRFLEVFDRGPENPYTKHALPKLVRLWEELDDHALRERILDIAPEHYSRSARSALSWLRGEVLLSADRPEEAREAFQLISTKSDYAVRAGVRLEELGEYGALAHTSPRTDLDRVAMAPYLEPELALEVLKPVKRGPLADLAALERARVTGKARDLPRGFWIPEHALVAGELGQDRRQELAELRAKVQAGDAPEALEAWWLQAGHQAGPARRLEAIESESERLDPRYTDLRRLYEGDGEATRARLAEARGRDLADTLARIDAVAAQL